MATEGVDLQALQLELSEATHWYEEARRLEQAASRDTTSALNRLNSAQKALDNAVAELRKQAPRDTDWKRSKQPPENWQVG